MDVVILKDSVTSNLTDEEFFRLCAENPDLRIERNSNLEISIMSPLTTLSSFHSSQILIQLAIWAEQDQRGIVFDSSTGYSLPDKSVFSPDVSWVFKEKWESLSLRQKDKFAPICPDFLVEVRSKSDSRALLENKMLSWIKNGAALAWLVDPREEECIIYRPGATPELLRGFDTLAGEGLIEGFVLDLKRLKNV